MKTKQILPVITILVLIVTLFGTIPATAAPEETIQLAGKTFKGEFSNAVAFDISPTLRDLASQKHSVPAIPGDGEIRPDRGPAVSDTGFSGDGAIQQGAALKSAAAAISAPIANFEGLSNQDNLTIFGGRVNPPDPNGEVGTNHYVEMINLVFGVYSKTGTLLLGPVDTGALWAGFAVPDCTDPSGDPIVLYDQFVDRWLLSQFTTRGMNPNGTF